MDHTEVDKVLKFWIDEIGPKGWYSSSDEIDTLIQREFGGLHAMAVGGMLSAWTASARGALALIILLDQFSRNMYRGSGRAFASDGYCLSIAKGAVARKLDLKIPEPERQFFYLPLMHSETLADQEQCLRLFLLRCPEIGHQNAEHAIKHREVIRKFGRFPSRNAALGRTDSDAELAYRKGGGYMS
jgi:uncharacterized protein (DUF924 family)